MLSLLRVTDFILFGRVEIEFGDHLNVISGETGAGKSILLGAVEMLLGGDAGGTLVRAGAEKAVVEGLFYLDSRFRGEIMENGLLDEDPGAELVIRREISATTGRSRCFVNGALANLPLLRALAERLIQVHGQQEHQFLTRGSRQLELLDSFADLTDSRAEFAARLSRFRAIDQRVEELRGQLEQGRRERELAVFQFEEIEKAGISADEESALNEELKILENAESITEVLASMLAALEGDSSSSGGDFNLLGELSGRRRQLESLTAMISKAAPLLEQYDTARFTLEEVAAGLRELDAQVEPDAARLDEVRSRLDEYYRLKKKYGPEVTDVLATAGRLKEQLSGAERGATELEELLKEKEQAADGIVRQAAALSEQRKKTAKKLELEISSRMSGLAMDGGRFEIDFQPVSPGNHPGDYLTTGNDRVTFLLSTNPGVAPRPLSEVASGGELSRIMLALKSALAQVEDPSTMIFDEVDAGIGGKVGGIVGSYLSQISGSSQVLVITHLASIAAKADTHLVVEKASSGQSTETRVRMLDDSERTEEIARMLGGDTQSSASLAHARQMLEQNGTAI